MKKKTHAIFKTLFLREVQGAIADFRFWVVLVLCLSIMPLSFYVSVKDYAQRLSDYRQNGHLNRLGNHYQRLRRAGNSHTGEVRPTHNGRSYPPDRRLRGAQQPPNPADQYLQQPVACWRRKQPDGRAFGDWLLGSR